MSSLLGLVAYESDENEIDGVKEEPSPVKSSPFLMKENSDDLSSTENSGDGNIEPIAETSEEKSTTVEDTVEITRKDDETATNTPEAKKIKSTLKFFQQIPPASTTPPDTETLETINRYLEAKSLHEFDLSENIKSNKEFGNPYILTKVVKHYAIDEIGSNYPKELYDPHKYTSEDFEENIRKRSLVQNRQPVNMTKKDSSLSIQAQTTGMTTIKASSNAINSTVLSSILEKAQELGAAVGERKRKSKWGS